MNLQRFLQFQSQWIQGYNKVEQGIHTITCKQIRYYYTKCYESSMMFSKTWFCLLIKQKRYGSQSISKTQLKPLKYSQEDVKLFQNIFKGMQIKIIKNLNIKGDAIVVDFIDSIKQKPWYLSFQSNMIMKNWIFLINRNKYNYQNMLKSKSQIPVPHNYQNQQSEDKQKEIVPFKLNIIEYQNEVYCSDKDINEKLRAFIVRFLQPTFIKLVCQTELDQLERQIFIKDKMQGFNGQLVLIGKSINQRLQKQKRIAQSTITLSQKIGVLEIQNKIMIQGLKIKQSKIQQLQKEAIFSQNEIIKLNKNIQSLHIQIRQKSQSINSINIQLQSYQQQIKALNQQTNKVKQSLLLASEEKQCLELQGYFYGDILNPHPIYKKYLKQILQSLQNRQVVGSRLLFRFDEINKTNFHNYIDNRPHLLVIVRLCNGTYLAAYISDPIYPEMKQISNKSFITSLTKSQTFYLDANKKIFKYDQYFINFGNSQFQIKSQQKKIFSNFGIKNSFYQHKGRNINFLLNQGENKEAEIEQYEIFEIFFSEEELHSKDLHL